MRIFVRCVESLLLALCCLALATCTDAARAARDPSSDEGGALFQPSRNAAKGIEEAKAEFLERCSSPSIAHNLL
jgi:hypothetical protein